MAQYDFGKDPRLPPGHKGRLNDAKDKIEWPSGHTSDFIGREEAVRRFGKGLFFSGGGAPRPAPPKKEDDPK